MTPDIFLPHGFQPDSPVPAATSAMVCADFIFPFSPAGNRTQGGRSRALGNCFGLLMLDKKIISNYNGLKCKIGAFMTDAEILIKGTGNDEKTK